VTAAVKIAIRPLDDRIVVRPLDPEEVTAGGLVIPATVQEGEVLAAGPGRFNSAGTARIPVGIKPGDIVLYGRYAGTEIKHGGEEYLMLTAADVMAVVER
jgi:chaperonin GroES